MSGYKNFAVAGAGNIGKFIIEALLEKKSTGVVSSVSFLTRSSGGHDDLVAKGAKLIAVDYTSPSSLESALAGVDVVISALNITALSVQEDLARSAKSSGVKLFVPSEYGFKRDRETPSPVTAVKDALYGKLKEMELAHASFCTGSFSDMVLQPQIALALGFDFVNGKFAIPGSGTALISWTTQHDIARFMAHVLTVLPKEKLEGHTFRIEGDRICFNQIIEDWAARAGKEVSVSHVPRSVIEEAQKNDPSNIFNHLKLRMDSGKAIVGEQEELSNGEFVGWKPKKVVEILLEHYQ